MSSKSNKKLKKDLRKDVRDRANYLRSVLKGGTPAEFVFAFYQVFDQTLFGEMARDPNVKNISCRKGCHFCCRMNVMLTEAEASLIGRHCQEQNIPIPKRYLEEQLKYDWQEVSRSEVGWCTFLKQGECSIYAVRPLACRKYLVSSLPERCDILKNPAPNNFVQIATYFLTEFEGNAFQLVMSDIGKRGRLPEMLLPFSQ